MQVFALICDAENPQVFTVEFIRGQIRRFSSTERYTHVPLPPLDSMALWVFCISDPLIGHFSVLYSLDDSFARLFVSHVCT